MPWPRPGHLQVRDGRATPQLSAEVYGEPQTSQAARAGQNGDRRKFNTGQWVAERAAMSARLTISGCNRLVRPTNCESQYLVTNRKAPMKKLLCTALLSTLLISCHATARFYPVQGPLAAQTPAPVLVGRISGAFYSGSMTLTGLQREGVQGRSHAVKQPCKSTAAPSPAPADDDIAP